MSSIHLQHIQAQKSVHVALGILLIFVTLAGAMYLVQLAHLLKIVYPAVAFGIAGWLYATRPPLYLGFAWWIWLVTPFIRRLVEYQSGFDDLNLIMIAPLAVTLPVLVTPLRFGGRLGEREYRPYILLGVGVMYGFLVGLPKTSIFGATLTLLTWLLPIAIAFHVHVMWKQYPMHRTVVRSVFRWGILLLGVYGVLQYVNPAPWDRLWMISSGMTSIGNPEPYGVRVFSMLNSPGPFASVMMAGLVVLFADSALIARLAIAPAFVAFLLALVRATWGEWVIGLGYMTARSHGVVRGHLLKVLVVSAVLVAPLLFYEPITEEINDRVQTLTTIRQDNSFRDRTQFFRIAGGWVLSNPIGAGLGATGRGAKMSGQGPTSFDSGILAIPYTLGWAGALFYFSGFALLLWSVLKIRSRDTDLFSVACAAVVVAMTAHLLFANSLTGLHGVIIWTFLGLALASRRYHAASESSEES